MKKPSRPREAGSSLRDKIIGLGDRSIRKSYYPQLRQKLEEVEKSRSDLEERSSALLNTLADLENARSRLADSEARYRQLVENINDVIFRLNLEGTVTYVSPVIQNFTGLPPEQIIGRHFKEFIHPDDQAALLEGYERDLAGNVEPHEFRLRDKDGGFRHVRASSRPLMENGQIAGLTGSLTDITERKRLQTRERIRTRALEKLIRGDALGDILDSIIRGIEEEQKHVFGSILLLDRTRRHLQHGAGPSLPPFYNQAIHGVEIGPAVGSCGTAAYTGKRVIVEDIQTHPYWAPYRELASRAGLASCWSEPIINRRGQVIGTFALYHREPCAPTPDDIDLIQSLANLAGVVIEHHQTEEEIRKLNVELEQRVQQRTKELAESEQRFRTIYETAPVSIWQEDWTDVIGAVDALRREGVADFPAYFREHPEFVTRALNAVRILDVNQWTLQMFAARSKPAMLGSLETVFATPETLPGFVSELIALAEGNAVYRTEMTLNTVNGDRISVLLTMSLPPPASGSGNVLVSLIDVTERKRAEQNIRELNEELRKRATVLEATNKELESFSYSVSHDLRAPLRALDGFSRALIEDYADKLDDEGKEHLRTIRASSQKMGRLIDDLLRLSQLSRGELHCGDVDFSRMIADVAAELKQAEPDRNVEFVIAPGCVAYGDASLLKIALENILRNAWKYTGKKTSATIEFGVKETSEGRVYFVQDNGCGFDMQYAKRLFGAFQRLHTASEYPGTGLGLASVQRIIHRHRGRVWIDASVDKGATVFFVLPDRPSIQ